MCYGEIYTHPPPGGSSGYVIEDEWDQNMMMVILSRVFLLAHLSLCLSLSISNEAISTNLTIEYMSQSQSLACKKNGVLVIHVKMDGKNYSDVVQSANWPKRYTVSYCQLRTYLVELNITSKLILTLN